MSDLITKKCDQCGEVKKEGNGWFFIATKQNSTTMYIGHLGHIDYEAYKHLKEMKVLDLCGLNCLLQKIQSLEFISGEKTS